MLFITLLDALARVTLAMPGNRIHGHERRDADSLVTVTVDGFPSVTPAPTHCDDAWCAQGTTWCEYWAGVTGWDRGQPKPGETPVPLGACTTQDVITETQTEFVTMTV